MKKVTFGKKVERQDDKRKRKAEPGKAVKADNRKSGSSNRAHGGRRDCTR